MKKAVLSIATFAAFSGAAVAAPITGSLSGLPGDAGGAAVSPGFSGPAPALPATINGTNPTTAQVGSSTIRIGGVLGGISDGDQITWGSGGMISTTPGSTLFTINGYALTWTTVVAQYAAATDFIIKFQGTLSNGTDSGLYEGSLTATNGSLTDKTSPAKSFTVNITPYKPVPVPGTLFLLGAAVAGFGLFARKKPL